jgi:hypothetical protein
MSLQYSSRYIICIAQAKDVCPDVCEDKKHLEVSSCDVHISKCAEMLKEKPSHLTPMLRSPVRI